jgi:hypothetical protein
MPRLSFRLSVRPFGVLAAGTKWPPGALRKIAGRPFSPPRARPVTQGVVALRLRPCLLRSPPILGSVPGVSPNLPSVEGTCWTEPRLHRLGWLGSSFQYVDDGQLPDQLAVSRQYELKSIYNLLSHKVIAHVPSNEAMKRLRYDVVQPQLHCGICPMEPVRRTPPLKRRRRCSGGGRGTRCVRSIAIGL